MTFWLPAATLDRVEREARKARLSRSKFVAQLVRRVVQPDDVEPARPAAGADGPRAVITPQSTSTRRSHATTIHRPA